MKNSEIYWMKGTKMKQFHAFTLDSGISLCGKWFMGGRAVADDWCEADGKKSKCELCKAELKEKVMFT